MLKWIGRIVYFIIIAFLSLQVYGFAYFEQLNAYYKDNVEPNIDDPILILEGMNTLLGLSYFQETPFYEVVYDGDTQQFTLGIYAVGAVTGDTHVNGYAIVVSDVAFTHNNEPLERTIFKLTVEMDQSTFLNGDVYEARKSVVFDSGAAFSFQNVPLFFIFDFDGYNLVKDSDVISLVSRIELSYGYIEEDTYQFSESLIFLATTSPTNQSALFKDDSFSMTLSDYQLPLTLENNMPNEAEMAEFGLNSTRGDIAPYQGIMTRYIVIFIVIVLIITYFLFFHKGFLRYLKNKKKPKEVKTPNALFKDNE